MMMNRREFVKGSLASLGFLALPGGLFAAPAGFKSKKQPNLVFGILADSHLMVAGDGVSPHGGFPHTYISNAFRLFFERGIDAFVHLGDAAHRGAVRELEFHRERFEDVFGKRGGPAKLLVAGNHEYFGDCDRIRKIWPVEKVWREHAIKGDFPRNWERAWGEKFEECWHREVNGYHFFGRHWLTDEVKFAEFILSHAESCGLKGSKPFFILSHARNHFHFCHALRECPNAIAFFGHWHQSNADWKSIYFDKFGGFFPSIECGACRFDGGNTLDANESVLKEKWVLPLKWREKKDANGEPFKHPFSRDMLARRIGTPEFPAKAKLEIGRIGDSLKLKIPLADGNEKSRVFAYDVVAIGDDPAKKFFKSAYFEGVNLGIGHEPDGGITKVELPMAELPAGKNLTIAVRPISSLGTKGKTIGTTWKV